MLDKFKQDYNYKYTTNFKTKEKNTIATITLWKTNNRISYMRGLLFLEKFFAKLNIKNIKVNKRGGKLNNYVRYEFPLKNNTAVLFELRNRLPEPEISRIGTKYLISYNFYRFLIELPVLMNDEYMKMKLNQIFPEEWRDI